MNVYTVGQLMRLLKEPRHRVLYAISSRSIAPCAHAAGWRLFDDAALSLIRSALREQDSYMRRRPRKPRRTRA
jgi:hypothetical protein